LFLIIFFVEISVDNGIYFVAVP